MLSVAWPQPPHISLSIPGAGKSQRDPRARASDRPTMAASLRELRGSSPRRRPPRKWRRFLAGRALPMHAPGALGRDTAAALPRPARGGLCARRARPPPLSPQPAPRGAKRRMRACRSGLRASARGKPVRGPGARARSSPRASSKGGTPTRPPFPSRHARRGSAPAWRPPMAARTALCLRRGPGPAAPGLTHSGASPPASPARRRPRPSRGRRTGSPRAPASPRPRAGGGPTGPTGV